MLTYGTFEPMYEDQERIFAFKRTLGKQCLTVICNESSAERFLTLKRIMRKWFLSICRR
ncbi:MAG: hypothetical protein ACLURV_05155 [Gallintestinimicrobium sp.]